MFAVWLRRHSDHVQLWARHHPAPSVTHLDVGGDTDGRVPLTRYDLHPLTVLFEDLDRGDVSVELWHRVRKIGHEVPHDVERCGDGAFFDGDAGQYPRQDAQLLHAIERGSWAASLVRMVNAAGPEMDQGESVTVFNDLCVLAPSALLDAPVVWETIDSHHVRGAFTRGAHTVTAVLVFNDAHELIDFISDDRAAASVDGKHFVTQRWSTPLRGYRSFGAIRIASIGEGRWHAPDPEGEFTYIDFHIDDIAYNAAAIHTEGPGGETTLSDAAVASAAA